MTSRLVAGILRPPRTSVFFLVAGRAGHWLSIAKAALAKKFQAIIHAPLPLGASFGFLIAHFAFRSGFHFVTSYYLYSEAAGKRQQQTENIFNGCDTTGEPRK